MDRDRQHDPVGRHRSHGDGGAVARRIVGHERLDDEAAARRETVGDGREAGGLAVSVGQVEQRVVGDEDQLERPVRQVVDHVADAQRRRGRRPAWPRITSSIAALASIPHTVMPRSRAGAGERDRQPAGADAELEHGAAPGEPEQGVDGGVDVGQSAVPVVVHVGEPVAVRGWSVALHRGCTVPDGRSAWIGSVGACSSPTYLDHAATTPMRPEAIEAMLPFFDERFANPSGSHRFARDARRAVDEARDRVAGALGVHPGEVVFTGCGTESDNAAIVGALGNGGTAVCAAAEHHAVLHVGRASRRPRRAVSTDAGGSISTISPPRSDPTSRSSV